MFDFLFIFGMVSYRVLEVGSTKDFYLAGAMRVGGFLDTFQDRYFWFDTVIVLKQKSAEALPAQGALLSEVFTMPSLKRYFSRRSTKQRRQVHPGDTFQPQGLTPAPMTHWTSRIFLSQALLSFSLDPFLTKRITQSFRNKKIAQETSLQC